LQPGRTIVARRIRAYSQCSVTTQKTEDGKAVCRSQIQAQSQTEGEKALPRSAHGFGAPCSDRSPRGQNR
ncbi:MAG: hypothetical protein AAF709_02215, partial [Pseudomonadota bacterium]